MIQHATDTRPKNMKDIIDMNMVYRAPMAKVVEIEARNVLCESNTNNGGAGIEGIEGEDNLNW